MNEKEQTDSIYKESVFDDFHAYQNWVPLFEKIETLLLGNEQVLLSIDGCCGSGKTTCALLLKERFDAAVFHMDDYYLPMAQRPENWQTLPAGNMDLARFQRDVLLPARAGKAVDYCPFHCQTQAYGETVRIAPARLMIVEGSYAQHPDLRQFYDWNLFLVCQKEIQKERLSARVGARYAMFEQCWIPLEEQYYAAYGVQALADLVVDTSNF